MFNHYYCCDEICRIVPPHMIDKLLESKDIKIQKFALKTIRFDNFVRMDRITRSQEMRFMKDTEVSAVVISEEKVREIYDAKKKEHLPGELIRKEGLYPS